MHVCVCVCVGVCGWVCVSVCARVRMHYDSVSLGISPPHEVEIVVIIEAASVHRQSTRQNEEMLCVVFLDSHK